MKSRLGFFPQAPSINNFSLCISRSESLSITSSLPQGAGGTLPWKSDGDARHLALLCKLQILVSFRVFGMDSHCICPFRYYLGPCIRKFTKKCCYICFSMFSFKPHSHWSPLGVSFSFPRHFYMGVPSSCFLHTLEEVFDYCLIDLLTVPVFNYYFTISEVT